MRFTVVSSTVAVAAAAVLFTPVAAHATTGLDAVRVKGATATGTLQRSVSFTVALAPRDKAGLAAAARKGSGLTPAAFNAQFAPSTATVDAVRSWASASGLSVDSVSANRTLVGLSGSSAAVGKAFGTTLQTFKAPDGSTFFAPASAARLPATLAGSTTAVLGLSDLGRVGFSPQASSVNFPASYGPQDITALYGGAGTPDGAGQQLSVIAEGDLSSRRRTSRPSRAVRAAAGDLEPDQVGAASTDTSGSDEWDLDTQYSTGHGAGRDAASPL